MTALTDREIRVVRDLHRAARTIRGELDCMVDAEASFPGDPERQRMIAEAEDEVAGYVATLAEYGVSIDAPFALPPLPADYWVGNT